MFDSHFVLLKPVFEVIYGRSEKNIEPEREKGNNSFFVSYLVLSYQDLAVTALCFGYLGQATKSSF